MHCVVQRESVHRNRGKKAGAEHQAQQSEQTLGFQRLKSQCTSKPEFLSVPSFPSVCFLPASSYSTQYFQTMEINVFGRHNKNTYAEWINILLIKCLSYSRDSFPESWALLGPSGMSFPALRKQRVVLRFGKNSLWKLQSQESSRMINTAGMIRQHRSWGRWNNPWRCCCAQVPLCLPSAPSSSSRTWRKQNSPSSAGFHPKKTLNPGNRKVRIDLPPCAWGPALFSLSISVCGSSSPCLPHCLALKILCFPELGFTLEQWHSLQWLHFHLGLSQEPSGANLLGRNLGQVQFYESVQVLLCVKYLFVDEAHVLTERVPDTGKYLWSAILSGGIIIPFPFALQSVWQPQSRIHNTDTKPNCHWHFPVWEILNLAGKLWKLRSRQWKCEPRSYYSRQTLKSHFVWPLLS